MFFVNGSYQFVTVTYDYFFYVICQTTVTIKVIKVVLLTFH